ncbi:hypothetical protein O6H91_14G041200 [Diphasiastrum complanatum]|uniref:Uncharacterized protein n=1 Tax=Diphasiastrum complanatum TaxID=34168 RepID=A0ACC2BNI1_DIPCM|nr:hypothetical protein O6H91_14G041200 [Diphasiastrum complanatum]
MLQARCFSTPVYGRSHFKKFWLRKSEKEKDSIEVFEMSSPVVSQHAHQQMSASLSSCDYRKLGAQSPVYSSVPITGGSMTARMHSVGIGGKFGSIAPTQMQMVIGSTCGSEISSESLDSRKTLLNVVQADSVDEVAAISVHTVGSQCPAIHLDQNDFHRNQFGSVCTPSLCVGKNNNDDIPPRHSRSGSPVLVTSGPNHSSKILVQPSGISLQSDFSFGFGDGDDKSKGSPEPEITDFDCKSVHPAPSLGSQQDAWNTDSFPNGFDQTLFDVGRNAQLCAAIQSVEGRSKSSPAISNCNPGHSFIACTSPSFRQSTVSPRHRRMDSVDTDGWGDKIFEQPLDVPVLDSASVLQMTSASPPESGNAALQHSCDGQNQDASRKLLCTESWTVRSSSKENDYNEESEKASGFKTNIFSRNRSFMNGLISSHPSPKPRQQLLEGGSSRNLSRTCSHCGTMKTPLWRSGPLGPKSLCNACGIRLKKAGRRVAMSEGMDNSDSPPPTPKSAVKLTSKPSKRKLDKPNYPVDAWVARARLKAAQNYTSNVHLSKKNKIFSAQFRKVQAGEVYHEKAGSSVRRRNLQPSSPLTSPGGTSSACTTEFPDEFGAMQAFEARKRAVTMARREFERLEAANPSRLRRVFAKDAEEGAVLLMALSYGLVNA